MPVAEFKQVFPNLVATKLILNVDIRYKVGFVDFSMKEECKIIESLIKGIFSLFLISKFLLLPIFTPYFICYKIFLFSF